MANVCDKRRFMIGLDTEMEIVVETGRIYLEFILKYLPRVAEISKSTT